MGGNSKVIYLQRQDGASIKAYVVDYLFNRISGKNYVIVANQEGKNAKAYELVDGEAVILSASEIGMFRGYRMNPDFERVTSKREDGLKFDLVKVAKKAETVAPKEEPITKPVEAEAPAKEPAPIELKPQEEKAPEEEISESHEEEAEEIPEEKMVEEEEHEEAFEQPEEEEPENKDKPEEITEDPEEKPVEEHTEEPKEEEKEPTPEKSVIFYMYDQNVVKKYKAFIVEEKEDGIKVKNVKAIEVITGAAGLDVEQFLRGEAVEVGAYFVDYDNYNPTIENENGKLMATATLTHAICKTEDMVVTTPEPQPEPEKPKEEKPKEEPDRQEEQNRVLVFNGDIDVYDGETHYTIWGCFCTVVSENPLTIIPDKNGVKTIIYEDEKATSISEVCQTYQNLYPNFRVLLTGTEIKGQEAITLEDAKKFTPQADMTQRTLLENGRKVLTEAEMIEKRKQELEEFKKKS